MLAPLSWKHINANLLRILGVLAFVTVLSVVYLIYTLLTLDRLTVRSAIGVTNSQISQQALAGVQMTEADARNYILTGDPKYRIAYDQTASRLPALINKVSKAQNNSLSSRQSSEVEQRVLEHVKITGAAVRLRAVPDREGARGILFEEKRLLKFSLVQANVADISKRNLDTSQRELASSRNYGMTAIVAVGVAVMSISITCIVIALYFRKTVRRENELETTKNEFLSLASHQLRTPATNVKQYVGMLLDGYLGDITDSQRKALEVAYKNNESEIRIMNDLLDVAKVDLKRIHIQKQSVDAVQLLSQVIRQFRPYAEEHHQTLIFRAPPIVQVSVDRIYFKGVIENLLDNAMKYSKDNTTINITMTRHTDLNSFKIIVQDEGLGIQSREISKLFTKFSRLTNDFSANTEGSGLGLYWVKQIVALHSGTVRVVSQEGRGSKFIVRLPIT